MANASAHSFDFADNDSRFKRIVHTVDTWTVRFGQAMSLMTIAALGIGLGLTQYLHGRISELRTSTEILKVEHGVIAENKYRLEMVEAQIGAKSQIISQAKRKLRLMEPEQWQLQQL